MAKDSTMMMRLAHTRHRTSTQPPGKCGGEWVRCRGVRRLEVQLIASRSRPLPAVARVSTPPSPTVRAARQSPTAPSAGVISHGIRYRAKPAYQPVRPLHLDGVGRTFGCSSRVLWFGAAARRLIQLQLPGEGGFHTVDCNASSAETCQRHEPRDHDF